MRRYLATLALLAVGCGDGEPTIHHGPTFAVQRPEHPRPDFRRDTFINLNTEWDFAEDPNDEGLLQDWATRADVFTARIQLPYAWEAPLSGLVPPHEGPYALVDTLKATTYRGVGWYRLHYPEALPKAKGKHWHLVFGAADFDSTVFINGREAGHHRGGYDPFSVDLATDAEAPFDIVVRVEDLTELNDLAQPVGKQGGTWYTRTSGIWQTVYLEQRPETHLTSFTIRPLPNEGRVLVTPKATAKDSVHLEARLNGKTVGTVDGNAGSELSLALSQSELWSPEHPTLYDLDATTGSGDHVRSYFGLSEVHTDVLPGSDQKAFYANGKPTYLRCVLDQSYYPGGVYTAPSLEAMRADLELAKDLGFNCIRLHIKPDEPVKLRLIDELGFYLVYDIPSLDLLSKNTPGFVGRQYFEETMRAVMERDKNHPSLALWVTFNENWGLMTSGSILNPTKLADSPDLQGWVREIVGAARNLDPTHPVEDNSAGGVVGAFEHIDTDSNSFHVYENDPAKLRAFLDQQAAATYPGSSENFVGGATQDGDPWWNSEIASFSTLGGSEGPGIFCDLFGILNELHRQPKLVGYVITQLTDVEYELNGFVSYDRTPKPDLCERNGVGLADLFGSEFVAFDWLPTQTVSAGQPVDVPLRLSQWSSSASEKRTLRLAWVNGESREQSLDLPPYAPLAASVSIPVPSAAGSATLVAELLDESGERRAGNRLTLAVK
ncbi:MAG: hypothetical protein KC776_43400 [Myxococcales bacterium]|nr:hypothetical protein [Myxococcales bacterium]MCB9582299.1 hypothetical protein [Polyangiaceae bacterium]